MTSRPPTPDIPDPSDAETETQTETQIRIEFQQSISPASDTSSDSYHSAPENQDPRGFPGRGNMGVWFEYRNRESERDEGGEGDGDGDGDGERNEENGESGDASSTPTPAPAPAPASEEATTPPTQTTIRNYISNYNLARRRSFEQQSTSIPPRSQAIAPANVNEDDDSGSDSDSDSPTSSIDPEVRAGADSVAVYNTFTASQPRQRPARMAVEIPAPPSIPTSLTTGPNPVVRLSTTDRLPPGLFDMQPPVLFRPINSRESRQFGEQGRPTVLESGVDSNQDRGRSAEAGTGTLERSSSELSMQEQLARYRLNTQAGNVNSITSRANNSGDVSPGDRRSRSRSRSPIPQATSPNPRRSRSPNSWNELQTSMNALRAEIQAERERVNLQFENLVRQTRALEDSQLESENADSVSRSRPESAIQSPASIPQLNTSSIDAQTRALNSRAEIPASTSSNPFDLSDNIHTNLMQVLEQSRALQARYSRESTERREIDAASPETLLLHEEQERYPSILDDLRRLDAEVVTVHGQVVNALSGGAGSATRVQEENEGAEVRNVAVAVAQQQELENVGIGIGNGNGNRLIARSPRLRPSTSYENLRLSRQLAATYDIPSSPPRSRTVAVPPERPSSPGQQIIESLHHYFDFQRSENAPHFDSFDAYLQSYIGTSTSERALASGARSLGRDRDHDRAQTPSPIGWHTLFDPPMRNQLGLPLTFEERLEIGQREDGIEIEAERQRELNVRTSNPVPARGSPPTRPRSFPLDFQQRFENAQREDDEEMEEERNFEAERQMEVERRSRRRHETERRLLLARPGSPLPTRHSARAPSPGIHFRSLSPVSQQNLDTANNYRVQILERDPVTISMYESKWQFFLEKSARRIDYGLQDNWLERTGTYTLVQLPSSENYIEDVSCGENGRSDEELLAAYSTNISSGVKEILRLVKEDGCHVGDLWHYILSWKDFLLEWPVDEYHNSLGFTPADIQLVYQGLMRGWGYWKMSSKCRIECDQVLRLRILYQHFPSPAYLSEATNLGDDVTAQSLKEYFDGKMVMGDEKWRMLAGLKNEGYSTARILQFATNFGLASTKLESLDIDIKPPFDVTEYSQVQDVFERLKAEELLLAGPCGVLTEREQQAITRPESSEERKLTEKMMDGMVVPEDRILIWQAFDRGVSEERIMWVVEEWGIEAYEENPSVTLWGGEMRRNGSVEESRLRLREMLDAEAGVVVVGAADEMT